MRGYCKKHFLGIQWFKEYFAVKATPNPYILSILKQEGFGGDCSSYPEMILCDKVGISGENVIFTSNDTASIRVCQSERDGSYHQY